METSKFLDYAGLGHIINKLKTRDFDGKGLSAEDFTSELKAELVALNDKLKDFDPSGVATDSNLAALQGKVDGLVAIVNSDGAADGDKILNKLNEVFAFLVGISSDDKLKAILDGKVDAVAGKGLSTNDYTDAEKAEVAKVKDKANTADVYSKTVADSTFVKAADLVAITDTEIDALINA